MDKTISSSSFDVIVIRQPNNSYKSTPFQVAFSSNLLRSVTKNNEVFLYVNQQKIDIPLRLDIQNGRIAFIKVLFSQRKKYQKRNILSDSSDFSDDDISQRSQSRGKIITKNLAQSDKKIKKDDFVNQKVPKPFWQFAWLFKTKNQSQLVGQNKLFTDLQQQDEQVSTNQSSSPLEKIDEQIYQGQQSSKQPMFHISLCKSALKKKQKRQQILSQFYKRRISYQQFIKDPSKYLGDSQLIVKIDDSLYTWELGIAILTCRLAYGKQLSSELIDDMIRNKFTKSKFITYFTGQNLTKIDISRSSQKKQFTVRNSSTNNFPKKIVTRYRKSPDTQTIQKMNLKEGLNKAKFILNSGTTKQEINMKIFLWDYRQKLIVSDIDGTITKSDIAGQLLTNYIHSGVTKLFAQAYKRGYKIVYLTARAIGQYFQTTKFLESAQQDGIRLPEGPLLMSPDGYLKSFTRQVIDKTPDYLKTKILASLNQIFPHGRRPLYCGFGNRETDSVAYLKINIDPERVFFITPKSIISKESKLDFTTTYVEMLEKIEEYFPLYVREDEEGISGMDEMKQSKLSVDLDEQYEPTNKQEYDTAVKGQQEVSQKKQEQSSNPFSKSQNQQQKQKQSLSSSSQQIPSKLIQENSSIHLSQRLQRFHPTQRQDDEFNLPPSKQSRSKSVEQCNQSQIHQPKKSLLKEIIRNINPFETKQYRSNRNIKKENEGEVERVNMREKINEMNEPLPQSEQYEAVQENRIIQTQEQSSSNKTEDKKPSQTYIQQDKDKGSSASKIKIE